MSAVTADMLKSLARELRKIDPPSLDRLKKVAGPVLQAWERYRATDPDCRGDVEGLVDFLKAQVMALGEEYQETTCPDKVLGAVLWHRVQVLTFLNPEEREQDKLKPATLTDYWEIVGDESWKDWQQEYSLPKGSNPFRLGRTDAYKWLKMGREILAIRLNGPVSQRESAKGGEVELALSMCRKAIKVWLLAAPDLSSTLTDVYVSPRLTETVERGRILEEKDLLKWLKKSESVIVQGKAGMGKSMLLRNIGIQLLEVGYLPIWMERGDVIENMHGLVMHLMEFLRGKTEIPYYMARLVADWGSKGRIVVLIDEGEKWNKPDVNSILRQVNQRKSWYKSVLVTLRSEKVWRGRAWHHVEIEWDTERLRELMERRGNSRLLNRLESWVAEGRLLQRPWEYAMAAEVNSTVETPIEMLRVAVMNRVRGAEEEGMRKQQIGQHLQTLRREAWSEIVEERDAWKPTRSKDISAANWGVQTRLMVEEFEGKYRFAHNLLRGFLASEYPLRERQRKSPKEILELLIGVQDWEPTVAWMGEIAVEDGKTEWAEQLVDAVAKAMAKSEQRSGWLRGAKAVGPVLRLLEGNEVARRVRKEAEHSLIALLPPPTEMWNVQRHLAQAVGEAFLAFAPLSEETVKLLWQEVYGPDGRGEGRRSLRLYLAGEPGIARRLLDAPGTLEIEYGALWLWEVARSPKIEAEALIGAAERIYKEENVERLHAVVGALSTLGTEHAAQRLGDWLVKEIERGTQDRRLNGRRADQIANGLSQWRGDSQSLCTGLEKVMARNVPWWVWRGYLRGALRIGKADVAAYLAETAVETETEWAEEQQIEVIRGIEAYGDERVVPYLSKWWHRLAESRDHKGQIWVSEALWGAENERGVLVRQSTRWLVRWLESADVSDDFLEQVAYHVLRPRLHNQDNEDIVALGQKWLERGAQESHTTMMCAGAYLVDTSDERVLDVLQKSERPPETLGDFYLAGRFGRWKEVLGVLAERLKDGTMEWDLVVLVGEEQYLSALPMLMEYYLSGEEWIAQAGLHHFNWEDVDVCLETVWQTQGMKVDQRTANLLWELGTPGAIKRVLETMGERVEEPDGFLPQVYREAIWTLLADYVEESNDEFGRLKVFGDIQSLCKIGEAWPWAVTSFFFRQLEDWDRDVAEQAQRALEGQINQGEIRVWQGQEWDYRNGLQKMMLDGTEAQRCMGLRWLSLMPREIGQGALERWELEQLLEMESGALQITALQYIMLQRRRDMLDKVQAMADKIIGSHASQYRREDAASLQSAVVGALGMLEEDGKRLVQIALGEGVIPTHGLVNAQVQALGALITHRQHLEALAQAVQNERAPAMWLTAASIAQDAFLEERGDEIIVRRGERTWSLAEWGRLDGV